MIFRFRLVSDEVDKFKREIEIDADATFLELRDAVCASVGYDLNPMCSFFICDDGWEKEQEITFQDMGLDSSEEVYLMEDSVLRDFIDDDGQRLIFVFDYLTDRSFFMEMKESTTGRDLKEPLCTLSQGTPPPQYMKIDEFESKVDAKAAAAASAAAADMDDEFYGSDSYNDDEFDAAGFDEFNF